MYLPYISVAIHKVGTFICFKILPSHAEVRTGLLTLVNSSITSPLSGMFELFEKKRYL